MIAVCWVKTAIVFVAIWLFALIWTMISIDNNMIASQTISATKSRYIAQQNAQPHITLEKEKKDIAIEIPGIELQIPSPTDTEDPIQIVYTDYTITNTTTPRGIVLLLHACSHSALKFFSPSQTCINCVGLTEELRIARLVIEEGYIPIAVSSINRVRGCWSMKQDVPRIESVLKYWREEKMIQQYVGGGNNVFAIGASSGGAFAAELLTRDIVQGSLVMVMSLSNNVMQKMRQHPKPIYLAPMPRDANTMQHVMQNYKDCDDSIMKEYIILDRTSCDSLPVTIEYLIQRVPGMTAEMGNNLIQQLKQAKHIDTISNMLIVDPTKSKWRDIITSKSTAKNKTHWMDIFDLTPGYSPLAKALHRAWAFHEYCSEVVVPALRFFESQVALKR